MKKKLFTTLLLAGTLLSFAQETCNFGPVSDTTGMGENISSGGMYEYVGAADFDVPFGTSFAAGSVTINILKGAAGLNHVNLAFLNEEEGLPGSVIQSFDNLIPTSQVLAYNIEEGDLDTYTITVNLPAAVVLGAGKYFLRAAANGGDANGAWWEITGESQTYGMFDYGSFEDNPWGGGGYYSKVFQVLGTCTPTGEEQPEYGDVCSQSNTSNNYEGGTHFLELGQLLTLADDFIVAPNTTFYLTDFKFSALMLGTLVNATIKIRSSQFFVPGEVLYSFTNKGPDYEEFNGNRPYPGSRSDVATVSTNFKFNEPVALTAGSYFIEITPTLSFSDLMVWESTTAPAIGVFSYRSYDGGTNWVQNTGVNQVFTVGGYCTETLGSNAPQIAKVQYYPNPVKDVLQLQSQSAISKVALYTIDGREVKGYTANGTTVNMQLLSAGMYIVTVQLENGGTETFKVIKE